MAMMERRQLLKQTRHRVKAFMALILFPMVVLLSGSSRTRMGLSASILVPPPAERATPVRYRPIFIYKRNIKRIEPEELAVGRNGTVVGNKNRVDNTADVVTSDVDTGRKAVVHVKNITGVKPMTSRFHGSATMPPKGKLDLVPFDDQLFENRLHTCGISDTSRNRDEYPVGKQKSLQFAHVILSGSMDNSYLNKSEHIAAILPRLMATNVTYAILPHDDYYELIPLEKLNPESSASIHYSVSEPGGLTEIILTTFAAVIFAWWVAVTMNIKALIPRCFGKNVYISILVVLFLAASNHVQSFPNEDIPPVEFLVLDERGDTSYMPFFNDMHELLEADTLPDKYGKYFLPPQKPGPPAWWISVEVKGDDINRRALLYFRSDIIYLLGFMNGGATLYCTDDAAHMFPLGCTKLGFTSSYHDLTDRGNNNRNIDLSNYMRAVLLGRTAARYAAQILVEYGVTIFEPALAKRAMLTYAIMISEALRCKPIRDQVANSWLHGGTLTEEQANMIFVWQDMSILHCRKDDITAEKPEWTRGRERLAKAKIQSRQDIINTLDFVKGEKQCIPFRRVKETIP